MKLKNFSDFLNESESPKFKLDPKLTNPEIIANIKSVSLEDKIAYAKTLNVGDEIAYGGSMGWVTRDIVYGQMWDKDKNTMKMMHNLNTNQKHVVPEEDMITIRERDEDDRSYSQPVDLKTLYVPTIA